MKTFVNFVFVSIVAWLVARKIEKLPEENEFTNLWDNITRREVTPLRIISCH